MADSAARERCIYGENVERIAKEDNGAYRILTACCKKNYTGVTAADLTAQTALPLEKVRELLPFCADEYQARLRVTASGEILYSFPKGFSSRYRGFRAAFGRFLEKTAHYAAVAAKNLFKLWILIMLVGYFVLFVLIALAAMVASLFARGASKNDGERSQGGGGGLFMFGYLIDAVVRIWLYSQLTDRYGRERYPAGKGRRPPRRALHKAVFAFVFGEGDVNADVPERERKAVLAYIQAVDGVISLPEYMIITGKPPAQAEDAITAFCVQYGGSPEATNDGTVVYRFDALLLSVKNESRKKENEKTGAAELYAGPLRRLNVFSDNAKNFNIWFSILNGVNLIAGAYFLFNAFAIGVITNIKQAAQDAYLYAFVYHILESGFHIAAFPAIFWGLGIVPFTFSVLFWLIPVVRNVRLKKENERVKLSNLRQFAYHTIWKRPLDIASQNLLAQDAPSRPAAAGAVDTVVTELSAYSKVDVETDDSGAFRYSFKDLEREKAALSVYRAQTAAGAQKLGGVVFDSGE